ncbi:MAG: hypothetical protein WA734_11295 [Candidatus Acidiferrales bacterium]
MRKTISSGTVFIKEGTLLPENIKVETERFSAGWTLIKYPDGYGLSRAILHAGWTFFCLSSEIAATTFGFDEEGTERKAIRKILEGAKSKNFNSLEIVRIASKRFLGLFYSTVQARSRHVKKSTYLLRDEADPNADQAKAANNSNSAPERADGNELPLEAATRPS